MFPAPRFRTACLVLALGLGCSAPAFATDVDGPDCGNVPVDLGDAPEGMQAYPGVLGAFPTCLAAGPIGTQTGPCPPISTPPGPAGFVLHQHQGGALPYWLGCHPGPSGIDAEPNGKVNDSGAPITGCDPIVPVDGFENAFGLTFGQDEQYGSSDAALAAFVTFTACASTPLAIPVTSCDVNVRTVYLNVLVDWNQDGDWNDSFDCAGVCVYEWAVKNQRVDIAPGCTVVNSPAFTAGPNPGSGWMRITISDNPVTGDFPWAGSDTGSPTHLRNGETEDYPVRIVAGGGGAYCPDYSDWGDAPEEALAYPGVIGRFPTCFTNTLPGNQTFVVPPISTPPGPTGYVLHASGSHEPKFWLGCGDPAIPSYGIDGELNGKMNDTGGPISLCDPNQPVDCVENAFGLAFGQDECTGDVVGDAGLRGPISLTACQQASFDVDFFLCEPTEVNQFYLNVLLDMDGDGDWNDNFDCGGQPAFEWAVKNAPFSAPLGCTTLPVSFLVGPNPGPAWMRITVTQTIVGDDFPWNGSAGPPGFDYYTGGETEDYPVTILGPDTCAVGYDDFGDAPEDLIAYDNGVVGRFPTCVQPSAAGTQEVECGTSSSAAPGVTGFMLHRASPQDPNHFWLGCGTGGYSPLGAVDSEIDGKVNVAAGLGGPSACNGAQATDCLDVFTGLILNQDECYGDPDAGVLQPTFFSACSTGTFTFNAWNCGSAPVNVAVNVLVDWNHDGDWNDNISVLCSPLVCAPEWAVQNLTVSLQPGCNVVTLPAFVTGPSPGRAWMRLSLTQDPVATDYPWNGSAGTPLGFYAGGETEDYVVNVVGATGGVEGGARGLWFAPPRPNPATRDLTLEFALPRAAEVSLTVHDLAGRRLAVIERGVRSAGVHTARWNFTDASGRALPAGHYIVKLRVGGEVLTRRAIRVR